MTLTGPGVDGVAGVARPGMVGILGNGGSPLPSVPGSRIRLASRPIGIMALFKK
jgi:hypothetical protein